MGKNATLLTDMAQSVYQQFLAFCGTNNWQIITTICPNYKEDNVHYNAIIFADKADTIKAIDEFTAFLKERDDNGILLNDIPVDAPINNLWYDIHNRTKAIIIDECSLSYKDYTPTYNFFNK